MSKSNTNRIALNSLALYINMVVTMAVTLLGTRFVLQALGEESYAVYALVANIVALFSFLNVAMAGASQRYLSYYMGRNDGNNLNEIFYNSTIIHSAIALISALLLLATGIPAIEYWLEIPDGLKGEATIVLLCMIGGVVLTVTSVPYEATMNAHEDITRIALINILDALCKLSSAIAVMFIPSNRLTVYALLIMCSATVAFYCKRIYSKKNYRETHFEWHKVKDIALLRQMMGYAGWNLIGNGCSIARYQGAAILLNSFFGLAYNAGYGISQQVNGFLMFFANSAVRPMRPHIIKSEGAGLHDKMIEHSFSASRLTSILLAAAMIPLYINMPFVLEVWLGGNIPAGALEFCRGFLVITLIGQLTIGQQLALESVGKIKRQHIVLGAMHLLPLLCALLLFSMGLQYYYIIFCIIAEELLCIAVRTYIAKKDAGIPVRTFITTHLLPCSASIAVAFIASYYAARFFDGSITKLVTSTATSTVLLAVSAFAICFTKSEKEKIQSLLQRSRR